MGKIQKFDVCVIGAGSGGLSVAAGTAQLGLKTCLIERGQMGGDCLNTGCVPSKSLIAAAKAARHYEDFKSLGVKSAKPQIDFDAVKKHVEHVITSIAPHDSQERFEGLGVSVFRETAEFISKKDIKVGDEIIRAKYIVIATGARPRIPKIFGLEPDKILTNENIFDLPECPEHLIVLGGGPVGIEMAQAHRYLGADVTVIDTGHILKNDDPDAVDIIRKRLQDDGIELLENCSVLNIRHAQRSVRVKTKTHDIYGSHILIATGRHPNVERLNLDATDIKHTLKGISVDKTLKTSQKNIFAIGDVTGAPFFTHAAGYQAGLIVRQIAFKMFWTKTDYTALPWVTYTQPELAHVGLNESQAVANYGAKNVRTLKKEFLDNDRARAENKTTGFIKVNALKNGRILGATIVGDNAGEMIPLWVLAINRKMKMKNITGIILPYPTRSEISKHIAGEFYKDALFSDSMRRLVKILNLLPF